MVSKEVETECTEEVRTEKCKEVGTENSGQVKKEPKEEDIVDTARLGCGAAKPRAGREVEVMKNAMKKCCFIRHASFDDLKESMSFRPALFSPKKEPGSRRLHCSALVGRGMRPVLLTKRF